MSSRNFEWLRKWMNEWVNKWMNENMNRSLNQWKVITRNMYTFLDYKKRLQFTRVENIHGHFYALNIRFGMHGDISPYSTKVWINFNVSNKNQFNSHSLINIISKICAYTGVHVCGLHSQIWFEEWRQFIIQKTQRIFWVLY